MIQVNGRNMARSSLCLRNTLPLPFIAAAVLVTPPALADEGAYDAVAPRLSGEQAGRALGLPVLSSLDMDVDQSLPGRSMDSSTGEPLPDAEYDFGRPSMADSTDYLAASGDIDLASANQQFANPLSSATLFITENDYITLDGDAVDDERHTNVTVIEPLLPFRIGDSRWSVVHRPILPIIVDGDIPIAAGAGGAGGTSSGMPTFDNVSGIGDLTYFAAFTPDPKGKFVWGAGPIFRFPSATDSDLGAEKWSAGPMAVALYSSKKFSAGFLNQNLISFAGEDDRADVAVSTLQYFAFYNFTPQWGVGMAPIISHDWKADSGDRWSVPVGIGVTHTFKFLDAVPARLLTEFQYYAVQRDTFGPEWNFRIALALFLPKPGS